MSARLTLADIQALLNTCLHPYLCQCRLLNDGSLVITVTDSLQKETYLTVAAVTAEQCRSEIHIRRLAQSISEELRAVSAPQPPPASA